MEVKAIVARRPLVRHDAAAQARYQEVKQLAGMQDRVLAGTPGTLKRRTQSGRRYWVREHLRADGRKVDEYLGPEGAVDPARVEALRDELELAKALAAGSAKLRLFGFQRVDRKVAAVLAALFNHGLFRAGLSLVGSHAYGVLLNELGVIGPGYRTQDVDVAQALSLAAATKQSLQAMLREAGLPFVPVPLMEFLVDEAIDAAALSPNQVIPVRVPAPERFALHKLYASQSRRTARDKVRKDLEQAALLSAALEEETPGRLREAFVDVPADARASIRRAAAVAGDLLQDGAPLGKEALLRIAARRG